MMSRAACCAACLWLAMAPGARAQEGSAAQILDLPQVLARAGADNLDLALAKEAVEQSKAQDLQATLRLFPYLSFGAQYSDHKGGVANVEGVVIDADKDLRSLNAAVAAQVDLGDAIGRKMVAGKRRDAAAARLDAQRATTIRNAALAYFDLVGATAEAGILEQSVATSRSYLDQISRAADIGLAARSEVLRVEVDLQSNEIALRQGRERAARSSAALAEILHLPPGQPPAVANAAPLPVRLAPEDLSLESLLGQAMSSRPELTQSRADMAAARLGKQSALYGPLLPSVTAQYGSSRLRGGPDGLADIEDDANDAQLLFTWRVGPGGLFDKGRIDEASSLARQAALQDARLRDSISREVADSREALQSAEDQMELARRNAENAARSLELSQQRRDFGIAAVLETIAAQQQLVAAQRALTQAITQYNRAQYSLARAIGQIH